MMSVNRKRLSKKEREGIHALFNGHCAYCGKIIRLNEMQVDHKIPLRKAGADELKNMFPACRSCNHYKATLTIEEFRKYLSRIHDRLVRDSVVYNVAERYGIVKYNPEPIVFYFEKGDQL